MADRTAPAADALPHHPVSNWCQRLGWFTIQKVKRPLSRPQVVSRRCLLGSPIQPPGQTVTAFFFMQLTARVFTHHAITFLNIKIGWLWYRATSLAAPFGFQPKNSLADLTNLEMVVRGSPALHALRHNPASNRLLRLGSYTHLKWRKADGLHAMPEGTIPLQTGSNHWIG
jgi:hypothetical protein